MEKYKVCPHCGAHNPPMMLECIQCAEDLTGVKVVDDSMVEKKEEISPKKQPEHKMVRICDCGQKNPAQARKCSACGEDISDIIPTPEDAPEQEPEQDAKYVLTSLDGQYAFQITEPHVTVGRENAMQEYLAAKPFVSRKHAEFFIENGKLFIQPATAMNHTFVNNERISDMEKTELHDGDEIALGGIIKDGQRQNNAAYFKVRISNVHCENSISG